MSTRTYPPSTLDLLCQNPYLRLPQLLTPIISSIMTTRSAEEADIFPEERERDTNRQKTTQATTPTPKSDIDREKAILDILTYTPIPDLDPIHIHGWDTFSTTENLAPFQVNAWKAEPGAKLLAYKAYGGRITEREEIVKLRNIIVATLNLAANPTIALPTPEIDRGKKDPNPTCSLIKNLLPEKAEELIALVSHATTRPPPWLTPHRDSCQPQTSRCSLSPSPPHPSILSQH
jgi:hypothetical protein